LLKILVSRALTDAVYEHTKSGAFSKDFGLRDQIQRAAVSIMSNIAPREYFPQFIQNEMSEGSFAGWIVRFLYPYGSVRRVLRGPLRGMKFLVEPDGMGLTFALGVEGAYHHRFLASRIPAGAIVYDVGANRGQTTLLFGRMVGEEGQVVSLEPVEELAGCIRRNVGLNDLENTRIIEAAAAEKRGTAYFEYYESRSTEGHLQEKREAAGLPKSETIQVQTVPLDGLSGTEVPPPDVMKIDVEGGAGAVFAGAQKLLDTHSPDIYIELHGPEEQQAVKDELVARGYVLETLDGSVVEDPTGAQRSPLWCTT